MSIGLDMLEALVPEAVESLKIRYEILECVLLKQPIGRRTLALEMAMTERRVRSETEIMSEKGLIDIKANGMTVTEYGQEVLRKLSDAMQNIYGFSDMENKLQEALGIRKVIIAKGNIDANKLSMDSMGKLAAGIIDKMITDGDTIAVTGGSTLRCVADSFVPTSHHNDIKVLPGRGGIGSDPELQSNTIASIFASKLCAETEILYLPDMLNRRIVKSIMKEPKIRSLVASIKNVNLLIFGIGVADEMAQRRGLASPIVDMIKQRGAVGEAFGYYFNQGGDVVYLSHTVGITLDEMKNIDRIVGVAGGAKKAKAILSVIRNVGNMVLVTDESAASEMCRILGII